MNPSDDDFDGDDSLDENESDGDPVETSVWQLLLLINPGDEDMALQQFADYRDTVDQAEEARPIDVICNVIDWRSGFRVDTHDTHALVQAINELSSRWNVSIDWHGDPDDDDFHADIDPASLFATAYDRLAEHGYTLWSWETDDDSCAGWITLTRDNEHLREVATLLDIHIRLGCDVS